MKEHGTLFQLAMVTALLADIKTQTRRIAKVESTMGRDSILAPRLGRTHAPTYLLPEHAAEAAAACPYGQPGDRIWVRETFYAFGRWETRFSPKKGRDEWHFVDLTIEAGFKHLFEQPAQWKRSKRKTATPTWWKRPAIFMPRVASRIALEITGVRAERLQDIGASDAQAEGCVPMTGDDEADNWIRGYRFLWEQINGAGSWDANPWVWVVEFQRVLPS